MTIQELADGLENELEGLGFGDVETECLFYAIKGKLGLKTKIPNTYTKKEMIEFGYPENEIIEVPITKLINGENN